MGFPLMIMAVAGTLLQGKMQADAASAQAQVANEQLRVDIENERIRAMQAQNKRQTEYLRADSANRVAVAFSGVRNLSFEQGLSKFNLKQAERDMRTIEFNKDMEVGRKQYEIKVNRMNAVMEGRSAMVGAVVGSAGIVQNYLQSSSSLLKG